MSLHYCKNEKNKRKFNGQLFISSVFRAFFYYYMKSIWMNVYTYVNRALLGIILTAIGLD